MANFDEFRQKTGEAAEIIAGKAALVAKFAANKAVTYAKIASLNGNILAEKDKARRAFYKLGKLYYEKYGDVAEDEMKETVEKIDASRNAIKEARDKINKLKIENHTKNTNCCSEDCCCTEDDAEDCCCENDDAENCCCENESETDSGSETAENGEI